MIDIAINISRTNQLDAFGVDRALNTATDGQFFSDDVALHLGALRYHDGRSMELALNATKDFYGPVAIDFTSNCHPRTDGRGRSCRIRRCGISNGRTWQLLKRHRC